MKLYLDCIPCFLKQSLFATKHEDEKKRAETLKKVMSLLLNTNWKNTPEEIANKVHNTVREETGILDPYEKIKRMCNEQVLKLYPKLKLKLEKSATKEERIFVAAKLAIAGNIIDFGPTSEFDLQKTIEEVLNKELAINDMKILLDKILSADKLLYFADNAREVGFDKLFIEEMIRLKGKPFNVISFVVKGGPIINDAMEEDVYEVGIDELPNLSIKHLGNGQKDTGPNRRDSVVKEWIKEHDLTISKGQGNFEGLSENKNIFFMLMAKCPVIAKELKINFMDTVIYYNQ